MKNNSGITLIALVITIIVLLILAGVSIAMLSGDNSILGNASKAAAVHAYQEANEQVKLAIAGVQTTILSNKVNDGTYDATEHVSDLVTLIQNELGNGDDWNITSSGAVITIVYTNSVIKQDLIETGKPLQDGAINYRITVEAAKATLEIDVASS